MSLEQVIVEWTAAQPYTAERLGAVSGEISWCHRLYGVTHLRSYIGGDGRQIVCVFAAPDAEAVRKAGRRSGSPVDQVWTAAVLPAADAPMAPAEGRSLVIVGRRFIEPADIEALHRREDEGRSCLTQHGVRHLRSYVARDGRRTLCLYEAPDAESVRQTQRRVGLPFEAAWPAAACIWNQRAAE